MNPAGRSGPAEPPGDDPPPGSGKTAAARRTSAREAEQQRFEDFLRAAVDWAWETDRELRLEFVSSALGHSLGAPAQTLLGRPLLAVGRFAAENDERAAEARAALEHRRAFRDARFLITAADGSAIAFRLSGVPYFDTSGRFAGYRGTGKATATEASAEAEVKAAGRQLVRTLEEVLLHNDELRWRLSRSGSAPGLSAERLASLLHELRTPLNAVMGYADLLLAQAKQALDERQAGYIANIREAGSHLQRLLAGLESEVPREREPAPETDRLDVQAVDIAEVLTEAAAMTELAARRAGVGFKNVQAEAPCLVLGERKALTQILINLLSNAVKFTPAGGEVGVDVEPSAGGVDVVVWDTGPGIPADEQQRIFERAYRLARDRGPEAPSGHGLGLAIARDLARGLGGDIVASSAPGQGARFVVHLRAARDVGG